MDMLLGLDILKRHQCIIDLHRDTLRIGSANIETKFLSENELPENAKLTESIPMSNMIEHEDRNFAQALARSAADVGDVKSSSQPATTSAATNLEQPSSEYSEQSITQIIKQGFTREQAINELKLFQGDVNKALTSLMTKSLLIPKRKR